MRSAILALALTLSVSGAEAQESKARDLLVVLTVGRNGPVLFVDNKLEKSGSYHAVFSRYFLAPGGKNRDVLLYVSDELPYYNVDGMVEEFQAVGFEHIKTFEFSRARRRGTEIRQIGQASKIPFNL